MNYLYFGAPIAVTLIASLFAFICRAKFPADWTNFERLLPSACFFVAFIITLMWFGPKIYVAKLTDGDKKLEIEDEHRKTLAQIIGGGLLLVGLVFSYTTYQQGTEQLKLSTKQAEVIEEGQVSERFTKAMSLMASTDKEVRLAGLYALEQISKVSKKEYGTIIEYIAAYLRERSQINRIPNSTRDVFDVDLQAAFEILARRTLPEPGERGYVINLRGADLSGARLTGGDFSNAILSKVNLNGATLTGTNFSNTTLTDAQFRKASLTAVNLSASHLISTILTGATLTRTDLTGALLVGADFKGAHFEEVGSVTFEQLSEAKIDKGTEVPAHLAGRKDELIKLSNTP